MKEIITKILLKDLGEQPKSISEIVDFGNVNNVYDVSSQSGNYIVRVNTDKNTQLEFLKEEWCINKAAELDVLVPKIIQNGVMDGYPYMIQEKIEGVNGSICDKKKKVEIWRFLGESVRKYSKITEIEIPMLKASEFHDNWKSKLDYNINQLGPKDSLLLNGIFNIKEHNEIRRALTSMKNKEYEVGLVHGDLSPRNVMVNDASMYLIDWGTAHVDIVPFNEIGIILIEGEANKEEFNSFLDGMGIDEKEFCEIEIEVRKSNILHRLDKYRWATDYDVENLKRYTDKLRRTYKEMAMLK